MYESFNVDSNLLITFSASLLIWILVLVIIFLWLGMKKLKTRQIAYAFFSAILAWVTSEFVKSLIGAIRPFEINGFPPLTLTIPGDASFPSGHAAFSFGLSTAIFLRNRKLGIICFIVSILVGMGRVLGNVHYPIDILAGAILGVFTPLISERFFFEK